MLYAVAGVSDSVVLCRFTERYEFTNVTSCDLGTTQRIPLNEDDTTHNTTTDNTGTVTSPSLMRSCRQHLIFFLILDGTVVGSWHRVYHRFQAE